MWMMLLACSGPSEDSNGKESTVDLPDWQVLGEGLPAALLSVTGTSASDVWAVSADTGSGATVWQYDGSTWTDWPVGTGDLWWVSVIEGTVYAVGAGGRVLQHDGGGSFTETVLDASQTLFGIWGSSANDLWAVGGDPNVASNGAAAWHFDGSAWSPVELPGSVGAAVALYKVCGKSASDVWAVGASGVGMHWDGATWTEASTGTTRNLYTVHTAGSDWYAVGGFGDGTVVHNTDGTWSEEPLDLVAQLNGVHVRTNGDAVAVGNLGTIVHRADTWALDPRDPPTLEDFHAVWTDPDGGMWAVGGHLSSQPLDNGVLVYDGPGSPPGMNP